MDAKQYYESGELTKAIVMMTDAVKQQPQNIHKRDFLRELLCIAGELERADKQLDVIVQQEPQAAVGAALIRQLIRAEQLRQQCFNEGRLPALVGEPIPSLKWHLQALIELRENNRLLAAEYLQKAAAESLIVQGQYNGQSFKGLRDLDDTCAGFFEVLTSTGKYYWVAIEQVNVIEFYPPERPLDLLWRRVHMTIENGPTGEVYMPAIYINTPITDELARLGHKTYWHTIGGEVTTGIGQRMFLLGQQAIAVMELQELIIQEVIT